eukprot:scaffold1736_cov127-Cylindrotheca_fusiformis.AAC.79
MDGEHPNRSVIFIDDAIPLPLFIDPNNPDNSYFLGFSLSSYVISKIEDFEPTLIHITVPDCTCLHLINYARKKELPLMGTYHSNIPDYMNHYPGLGWLKYILEAFFRHQYNFLQALYVPTPFIRKQLTQTLRMDKITNLQVWGRGIDLERFSPTHRSQQFRQHFGFSDKDVVLLWVGRLVPEKRPDIFIEVVRRLHARKIPFKALVVGAGPSEVAMKCLPNTVFTGWMNGDDLAMAYASSDVFLFPSAVETFGNVSLEAAASGLPIVVEEGCGGHLVRHGESGFACEQHDVDGFFNSVLCLVLDDERRNAMAKEGRKISLQYEKKTVCERMLDNYSYVTNEFYVEYGGHHANRDALYQKEHSFSSGNTPRPLFMICVESLLLLLIRVWHRMTVAFLYLRERMVFVTPAVPVPQAPKKHFTVVNAPSEDSFETARECSLRRIAEMEEVDMSYQDPERQDVLKEDDDTDSTSSLSTDSPFHHHSDLHPTHKMSIVAVRVVLFFLRTESRLRNGAANCCRSRNRFVMEGRKRKDTRDGLKGNSFESFASLPTVVREERLNMRRSIQV